MPRSVLFDLGNVLMRFDPVHFWAALDITDPDQQTTVTPNMLQLGRIYESGEITTEEFRARFSDLFQGRFSDEKLNSAFLSVLPIPTEGTEDLVARVSKRYETGLVSNTNPIHFDLCLRTTPALKHLDRFYVSYELGAMKPDDRFYKGVIEGEGYKPEDMIFIDDLPENIEGARRAGFDAILFRGANDLEQQLKDRSVLS